MKATLIILFSLILLKGSANAQKTSLLGKQAEIPFVLGKVNKIRSAILGEERTLNIYLPGDYNKDAVIKYPVIYLLDGSADEDFIHIVGLVQFLNMIQVLPASIVVGIGNVDRRKDFTFPSTVADDRKLVPTSGGSAKFISFIEKELQPYIAKTYRTNGERTIIGQSLGGLLATEILLKRPGLFDRYIIVSPSLWWDNESLLIRSESLLSSHDYKGKIAYVSVGSEGEQMVGDANKLVDNLRNVSGLKVIAAPLSEENHLTILHRSVYKAFEELNKK
ncbi:MAG: hypothetical protein JWQ38_126 [Flavipsychrobacter sp.]|nr:hypothetical protein [Flavipsychrobacter sp.]